MPLFGPRRSKPIDHTNQSGLGTFPCRLVVMASVRSSPELHLQEADLVGESDPNPRPADHDQLIYDGPSYGSSSRSGFGPRRRRLVGSEARTRRVHCARPFAYVERDGAAGCFDAAQQQAPEQ